MCCGKISNFDACQRQLAACDRAIEGQIQDLTATRDIPATPLPAPRVARRPIDNDPVFEIRTPLHQLTGGVDLTQIDGIGPYTALKLIAEIGTDMTRGATEKHFTAWLTLAPKTGSRAAAYSARGPSRPQIEPPPSCAWPP